jgi:hypothetical protein
MDQVAAAEVSISFSIEWVPAIPRLPWKSCELGSHPAYRKLG